MSRFNLSKGERFSFAKSEGLNNITATLKWDGDTDLDLSAFLVGEDGLIMDDADFVYYGSLNRSEPFSKEKFGNKNAWKERTLPMSADGSVRGAHDERKGGGNAEQLNVTLNKINNKITEIVFCATIFTEGKAFGDIQNPILTITNDDNGEELCDFTLNEDFHLETAVTAGSLVVNDDGDWEYKAECKGYEGGLETLTEIYAG